MTCLMNFPAETGKDRGLPQFKQKQLKLGSLLGWGGVRSFWNSPIYTQGHEGTYRISLWVTDPQVTQGPNSYSGPLSSSPYLGKILTELLRCFAWWRQNDQTTCGIHHIYLLTYSQCHSTSPHTQTQSQKDSQRRNDVTNGKMFELFYRSHLEGLHLNSLEV